MLFWDFQTKLIGVSMVLVVFATSYMIGRTQGYAKARAECEQAMLVAIAEQAQKSAAAAQAQSENSARLVKKAIQAKAESEEQTASLQKELDEYVAKHPEECKVSAEFERVFDAVGRVQLAPIPPDGPVPAPAGPAGGVSESPEAGTTTTEILHAYHEAVQELFALWDDYAALTHWVRSTYALARGG